MPLLVVLLQALAAAAFGVVDLISPGTTNAAPEPTPAAIPALEQANKYQPQSMDPTRCMTFLELLVATCVDFAAVFCKAAGKGAALFLLEYADGFKASLLHCQGEGNCVAGWACAWASFLSAVCPCVGRGVSQPCNHHQGMVPSIAEEARVLQMRPRWRDSQTRWPAHITETKHRIILRSRTSVSTYRGCSRPA